MAALSVAAYFLTPGIKDNKVKDPGPAENKTKKKEKTKIDKIDKKEIEKLGEEEDKKEPIQAMNLMSEPAEDQNNNHIKKDKNEENINNQEVSQEFNSSSYVESDSDSSGEEEDSNYSEEKKEEVRKFEEIDKSNIQDHEDVSPYESV